MTKEEFNKLWKDSTKEEILNQYYYDYKELQRTNNIINELEKELDLNLSFRVIGVRRLKNKLKELKGSDKKTKRLLKPIISNGYKLVSFKNKHHRVHRLVAQAFLDKTANELEEQKDFDSLMKLLITMQNVMISAELYRVLFKGE